MKRLILAAILSLAVGLGCQGIPWLGGIRGSGEMVEQERTVSDFTSVKLTTSGTLYIEPGESESLIIEAEDNLMDYLETEVRGDELRIDRESTLSFRPTKPIKFYLTVTELDSISVTGSGDVEVTDLSGDKFSVNVSGSGEVGAEDMDFDSLEIEISGSGGVEITGEKVREQTVAISGSGKYEGRDLESERAEVRVSGSGEATVWVIEDLQANVSGSGHVRYAGSPTVDQNVSGSGDVERIRE